MHSETNKEKKQGESCAMHASIVRNEIPNRNADSHIAANHRAKGTVTKRNPRGAFKREEKLDR